MLLNSASGILNSAVPGTNYNTAASNVGGGPIVVHCSAGSMDTTIYIALTMAIFSFEMLT